MKKTHSPPAQRRESCEVNNYFALPRSVAYLPRLASALSFGIAFSCLLAWLIDYRQVAVWMNPLTAVGVMLASASLWCLSCSPVGSQARWVGRFFLCLLVLLALAKLAHLQLNFATAPDRILFFKRAYWRDMDGLTAVAFVITG